MLTLVFGHTVFSVSIVLAAFMAGLGFGSYFFGYVVDQTGYGERGSSGNNLEEELLEGFKASTPLLIYGWIEVLIFLISLIVSLVLFEFSAVYSWLSSFIPESVAIQNTVKSLLAFGLMFIPESLMGETLPIIRY